MKFGFTEHRGAARDEPERGKNVVFQTDSDTAILHLGANYLVRGHRIGPFFNSFNSKIGSGGRTRART